MKQFMDIVYEASIDGFMSKIDQCQTKEGLSELEKYYAKRVKETDVKDTDDIAIRDALAGKKSFFDQAEPEEEEEF